MSRVRTSYLDNDIPLADVSTAQRAAQSAKFGFFGGLFGILSGTHGPEGAPPSGSNWILDQCCDSVSTSASNLFGSVFDASKWVRAGGGSPHSWYTGHDADGLYICGSDEGSADQNFKWWFALTPFTGGTTTARPTSTTEWALRGNSGPEVTMWSANAAAGMVHLSRDNHGSFYCLISQTAQAGGPGFLMTAQKIDDPCAADIAPFASWAIAAFGSGVVADHQSQNNCGSRNHTNTASVNLNLMSCGDSGGSFTASDSFVNADGKPDLVDAHVRYSSGGTSHGRKGRFYDMHFGPTIGGWPGIPATGNMEHIQFLGGWLPWSLRPTF